MKKLVLKLLKIGGSSVYNTPTKTGVLEVRNMRIIFYPRKPTSKERKNERRRERLFFHLFFLPIFFVVTKTFTKHSIYISKYFYQLVPGYHWYGTTSTLSIRSSIIVDAAVVEAAAAAAAAAAVAFVIAVAAAAQLRQPLTPAQMPLRLGAYLPPFAALPELFYEVRSI